MKKLFPILLALTCATSLFAYDCKIGGIYYDLNQTNKTATVTNKTGSDNVRSYSGVVVIPEAITYKQQNYTVTAIGKWAFYKCSELTSITLPNSITLIDKSAFCTCTGLTSVTIPNSVITIGIHAFSSCSGLTSVTIGNSVKEIGESAFRGCTGLTSLTIPNSVTTIGEHAFQDCSGLTSITIPPSVTKIGNYAFIMENLTSINVDATNTHYKSTDGVLFSYNQDTLLQYPLGKKQTEYAISNSVKVIGKGAFFHSDLASVTIPNSITTIEGWAFQYCTGLTSVTIPNSVTTIGESAFWECTGLTSVTIPNSVTMIGDHAFRECSNLSSVTIGNSVKTIGYASFYQCTRLTSIAIPNSVIELGGHSFRQCSNLSSVSLGKSVTTIGETVFCECPALTSITIPNSVTSIGKWAFQDCVGLKTVTILSNQLTIGQNAFLHCSIEDVYCGQSVDTTNTGGGIKSIHRLGDDELFLLTPITTYTQEYVETHINQWQQKGEYEKIADWQKRVNETTRNKQAEIYMKEAQKEYFAIYRQSYHGFSLGTYDAENEVYLVKDDHFGDLLVPVALNEAQYVRANWDSCEIEPQFGYANDALVILSATFRFPNKKTYTYKPDQKLMYSTADINYNFDPIELPQMQTVTMGGVVAPTQQGINAITITTPFAEVSASSVLAIYKNEFGKYEMPEKDETFPYVAIRVKLQGEPNLIRLAKQNLMLYLGQMFQTEQTVTSYDNMILFLIPAGAKNVYLTCGDGCERQLIYSGRLTPNTICDGIVEVK